VERATLAHSLTALAESPTLGPGMAAIASDMVAFAAGAIKEEGGVRGPYSVGGHNQAISVFVGQPAGVWPAWMFRGALLGGLPAGAI